MGKREEKGGGRRGGMRNGEEGRERGQGHTHRDDDKHS